MKILVVGWGADPDCDMKRSCLDAGVDFEMCFVNGPNPYSHEYMDIDFNNRPMDWVQQIIDRSDVDLYLFKYPFWLDQYPQLKSILHKKKVVAWSTEHGPTLNYALQASEQFSYVAVTNKHEIPIYQAHFPDKKILYLPFGCCIWRDDELVSNPKYASTLVADGACHYTCCCEKGYKRTSIDVMIMPVIDRDIAFYGSEVIAPDNHSWRNMPGGAERYRGTYRCDEYPQVYSSAKIYMGITFNWQTGGMGVKLARAMSTGIPVVWHATLGLSLEGLQSGEQLMLSSNPHITKLTVDKLLADDEQRIALGQRGKEWVVENWDYAKNLKRIASEIL